MRVFVVIPAYNEAPRIGPVLRQVKKYIKNIIVVDDGSVDKTGKIAKRHAFVLRHRVNLGKGAAVKTGTEAAFIKGASAVIVLDADGQHDPSRIPEFLGKLKEGFDVVFGERDLSGAPLVRLWGNRLGAFLITLFFGIYKKDLLCGFIAFTKNAYQKIKWDSARYGLETEIVARTGKSKLKYAQIPMEAIYKDKYKGVTFLDSLGILFDIPRWLVS